LVAFNLLAVFVVGLLLHGLFFSGEQVAFIMELPLYHLPNARTVALYVWRNLIAFLQKAGTIILGVSVIVWVLSYFPHGDVTTSYLATVGRWLEPWAGTRRSLADDRRSADEFLSPRRTPLLRLVSSTGFPDCAAFGDVACGCTGVSHRTNALYPCVALLRSSNRKPEHGGCCWGCCC
jgi:hypothetical protein